MALRRSEIRPQIAEPRCASGALSVLLLLERNPIHQDASRFRDLRPPCALQGSVGPTCSPRAVWPWGAWAVPCNACRARRSRNRDALQVHDLFSCSGSAILCTKTYRDSAICDLHARCKVAWDRPVRRARYGGTDLFAARGMCHHERPMRNEAHGCSSISITLLLLQLGAASSLFLRRGDPSYFLGPGPRF